MLISDAALRQSSMCVEVTRILERCQKESRAVDTETLCIIAGQKVRGILLSLSHLAAKACVHVTFQVGLMSSDYVV